MRALASLDWIVIAVYGAAVLGIGIWANRRQRSTEDYFLGGRRMRWWAVGISLIATSFSSVALIGFTGFGFDRGLSYLQLQVGDLLAIGIAVFLLLPFYAALRLTTAYEYLERRFGVGARTAASLLFLGQTLLRAGILVLVPALALSTVLEVDLVAAIVVSGLAAILYSAAGGITAVVLSDLIQLAVVVFGVSTCLYLIASDVPGGAGAVLHHARETGRLVVVDGSFSWDSIYNGPGALLAYGTLALGIAGTNQQTVQRYLACRDLGAARRAAFLGWGIGFVAVLLTLVLGVGLEAWSVLAPGGEVLADAGDDALPRFIVHRLPSGLAGLLVAAIFAASMSSMDSAIHSMSTATLVDFVRRFRSRPLSARKELALARVLTALFGVAATGLALVAATAGRDLIDLLLTWLGYVAGPLLGLFLLGVLSRRATELGALVGVGVASAAVVYVVLRDVPGRAGFHPLWLAPAACLATCVIGSLASRLDPAPSEAEVRGLTWWTRAP